MNDTDFADLIESIEQAGRIRRGQEPPSRVFDLDKPDHIVLTRQEWALLLDHIEDLEDALAVYRSKWQLATGQDEITELTPEDIREWLKEEDEPGPAPDAA